MTTAKYRRPGFKWCNDCKAFRSVSEFWNNKKNTDGLDSYCKVHSKARTDRYIDENYEEVQDYKRWWYMLRKDKGRSIA